jgi:hypothetical protein
LLFHLVRVLDTVEMHREVEEEEEETHLETGGGVGVEWAKEIDRFR